MPTSAGTHPPCGCCNPPGSYATRQIVFAELSVSDLRLGHSVRSAATQIAPMLNEIPTSLRVARTVASASAGDLIGTRSNQSAIGTRVTVRYGGQVQAQEVLAQSSYVSVDDAGSTSALATQPKLDLEIRWTKWWRGTHSERGHEPSANCQGGQWRSSRRRMALAVTLITYWCAI
jgi:ASPIC and UnbV